MEFHPLANAFPLIEGESFEEFKRDIKTHGQNQPVVIFEGMILDGRNRYRACQDLGIPHREIKFTDKYGEDRDPAEFVVSENIMRRHMDPGALAVATERLATAMAGRPRTTGPAGPDDLPAVTIGQAAKLTGASPTSIKKVRTVRKRAAVPVVEAMERGDLTPTAADNLSKRPKAEQIKIMESTPIKEVPAVAARAAAAKNTGSVPEPTGPGRGFVGPKVMLTRQMDLPDLSMVQGVAKDWAEHRDVIAELDPAALTAFLKELRKSRTATTRLIELIELKTRTEAPATPRGNGHEKGVDVPTEPPAKRAAPAARKAPQRAPKTPVTAKKTAPRTAASPVTGETLAARAAEVSAAKSAEVPVTGTLSDDAARTLSRVTAPTTDKDAK